jgi:hypothetical protein
MTCFTYLTVCECASNCWYLKLQNRMYTYLLLLLSFLTFRSYSLFVLLIATYLTTYILYLPTETTQSPDQISGKIVVLCITSIVYLLLCFSYLHYVLLCFYHYHLFNVQYPVLEADRLTPKVVHYYYLIHLLSTSSSLKSLDDHCTVHDIDPDR